MQDKDGTGGRQGAGEVFRVFLGLGLTSFGGPVAHLGYFREAFVTRRGWLSDRAYADLVALAQFLPGPASSQVGMAIGLHRAGVAGLLAAWTAFTLPSAILMVVFAWGAATVGDTAGSGWILGLKAAAVAVVAQAVLGMARSMAVGRAQATVAAGGMILALSVPSAAGQVAVILMGALVGATFLSPPKAPDSEDADRLSVPIRRRTGAIVLTAFFVLLLLLPVLAAATGSGAVGLVDSFYRAGALVFGGGHVVLPLLQAEFVGTGLVEREAFLAGYGAVQAVPGPLFTFSAYLGAAQTGTPAGVTGAVLASLAIFLPSGLLIVGAMPFWTVLRRAPLAQRALKGVNAAVVGLLAAALYDPVFTAGVTSGAAMAIVAAAFVALQVWRVPPWAVVIAAGIGGAVFL